MLSLLLPLLMASPATQQTAATPPQTSAPSRQQLFDRATAAMDAGKCEDALRDFQQLETRSARALPPAVAGSISLRKGLCLVRLGRGEAGEVALRGGIAKLTPLGAAHDGDIRLGRITLGRLAQARRDYGAAEQD